MRTLLNEVAYIEGHLLKTAAPEDTLLFEVKAIINPTFAQNVSAQRDSYKLIRFYGRKHLKDELEDIHHKLFTEPKYNSFVRVIKKLFGQS